ncbi:MAG: MFS transporter [Chloroflexota bacterium]
MARAIQGIGGSLLVPGGLALINATVEPARRGQMIGMWTTLTSSVIAFGPALGGWLVDTFSWRMVFFINIPLGLAAVYVALRQVPESRDEEATGALDWLGVLTLLLGLGGVLFGLIEGPRLGWQSPLIIGMIIGGGLSLIAFIVVEARIAAPMLPLHLFRNRNFSAINLVTLIHWTSLSGIFFFLTLNLQQVQGFSALAAGLAILPISLSIILLSGPVGRATDRVGVRTPIIVGLIITAFSFFLFMRPGIRANYWLDFFPAILVFGIGLGLTIAPVTTMAMGALPQRYSGVASGLNNAASRFAQMLAVAIFGAILVTGFQTQLADRTAELPLPTGARDQLLAESHNFGATQPPEGLSEGLRQTVIEAIQWSFVDSFQQVMVISVVLTLISLIIILLYIEPQKATDTTERLVIETMGG